MAAETQKRRNDEGGRTTGIVIGAAIEVHRALGPGLLERTYEQCLGHELMLQGVRFQRQVVLGLEYKGMRLVEGYRADLIANDEVVVEIKAVEQLHPVHRAQLLTYLRAGGLPLGLILNFNVPVLPDGIVRMALGATAS